MIPVSCEVSGSRLEVGFGTPSFRGSLSLRASSSATQGAGTRGASDRLRTDVSFHLPGVPFQKGSGSNSSFHQLPAVSIHQAHAQLSPVWFAVPVGKCATSWAKGTQPCLDSCQTDRVGFRATAYSRSCYWLRNPLAGVFAARRADAAVASLKRWRGILRMAKRRLPCGSVSTRN